MGSGLATASRPAFFFCTRLPVPHAVAPLVADVAHASWRPGGRCASWVRRRIDLRDSRPGSTAPLRCSEACNSAHSPHDRLLHEDGLADRRDGLGGGEIGRELEIMRDSVRHLRGLAALIMYRFFCAAALRRMAGPVRSPSALNCGPRRAGTPLFVERNAADSPPRNAVHCATPAGSRSAGPLLKTEQRRAVRRRSCPS